MSRKRTRPAMATRFRHRRRAAMRHGLCPATASARSPGPSDTSGSGSYANSATARSCQPAGLVPVRVPPTFLPCDGRLVKQEVPLRAELVTGHPLGYEVEVLRVEHRHPDGLVDQDLV